MAEHTPDEHEPATVEAVADLQAGLLDDRSAARLRQRIRTDAAAARRLAALERTRRAATILIADTGSAPAVPGEVTARIEAALRAQAPLVTRPARTPGTCGPTLVL